MIASRSASAELKPDEALATQGHEEACRRVASLFAEPWLRHYVRSKLRTDPAFSSAYELLRSSHAPILDVGCGIGLLAFYLRERGLTQPIMGIDLDTRKLRRASEAARERYRGLSFDESDVARELPAFGGNVVLFDTLHYLPPRRQDALLRELADSVSPGAMLLLRDCPRQRSARFWITYAGELFAQRISWNWKTSLHFPTAGSITAAFAADEFTRDAQPAWGATPFNNQLFIFTRRAPAAVPLAE